jgi:hypothetical protein
VFPLTAFEPAAYWPGLTDVLHYKFVSLQALDMIAGDHHQHNASLAAEARQSGESACAKYDASAYFADEHYFRA